MSFPIKSKQAIISQLQKLVSKFDTYQQKPTEVFKQEFQNAYDVTKSSGTWLCREDKELCNIQIETKGKVGCTTLKPAPASSVHPSQRARIQKSTSFTSTFHETHTFPGDYDSDELIDDSSYSESFTSDWSDIELQISKRSSTHQATQMVIRHSLSTRVAAKLCSDLADEGVALPTQSGVWRSVIRSICHHFSSIMC